MSLLLFISDLLGFPLFNMLALTALGGASIAFCTRFHPSIPNWISSLAGVVLLCISTWFFSASHYDLKAETDALRTKVVDLEQKAVAQQRIAKIASAALVRRAAELRLLEGKVKDYEVDLAKGVARACPPDPAYLKRMRALRFGAP